MLWNHDKRPGRRRLDGMHGLFGIGMDQRKAMPAMRQFWLAVRSQGALSMVLTEAKAVRLSSMPSLDNAGELCERMDSIDQRIRSRNRASGPQREQRPA